MDPTQIVKQAYDAFGKGDVETMLGLLADDVVWEHPEHPKIPWGGSHQGKAGVENFIQMVLAEGSVEEFEVLELVASGDRVVALGRERIKVKATGKTFALHWAHAFQIRDGQVAAFREYTDTAAIAEAFTVR